MAALKETTGGGAEGIRTPDLRIANAALSQLSYSPTPKALNHSSRPHQPRQSKNSHKIP